MRRALVLVAGFVSIADGAPALAAFPRMGAGRVGVPVCDTYLEKMQACAQSMPPEAGSAMLNALEQVVDSWAEVASTPDGAAALESGCQAAVDSMRSAMHAMCPGVF